MSYQDVTFYITAHQDDWELFRGEQAYADIRSGFSNKIVFIHSTAGDAGLGEYWWKARENGAIAAVRSSISVQNPIENTGVRVFNGHSVNFYTCANTVIYFLRLPDGRPNGKGFQLTEFQSLTMLRDRGRAIKAVDNSTSYESWTDFCNTMSEIVLFERGEISGHPWINASEYCSSINPGDHADHKATADAVRSFAYNQGCNRAWFLTYCISSYHENLSKSDWTNKKLMIDAYFETMYQNSGVPDLVLWVMFWYEWWAWGKRSYVRFVNWEHPDNDTPSPASSYHDRRMLINVTKYVQSWPFLLFRIYSFFNSWVRKFSE